MESMYVRFQAINNTGVAMGGTATDFIDMTCTYESQVLNPGTGAPFTRTVLASPEVFSLPTATLASATAVNTTSFDASAGGLQAIYNAECTFQVSFSTAAAGNFLFLMQISQDNITWPDVGSGFPICTLVFTAAGQHNGVGKF